MNSINFSRFSVVLRISWVVFLVLAFFPAKSAAEGEWQAGVASVKITPEEPVHLSGYASRKKPFSKVEDDLHAKALVLVDEKGNRSAVVTCDLIGMPKPVAEAICDRLKQKHGLQREEILLCASHTHAGPALSLNANPGGEKSEEDAERTVAYTRGMIGKVVQAVEDALANVKPARLSWGTGVAHFAVNRREFTPRGVILGVNPRGLADRSVPVLKIETEEGEITAALFSYACHNTTLTGDNYHVCGDYAGFAQKYIQEKFPSATALFMAGCGGDANPYPRGTMEWARRHGAELGKEVCRLLSSDLGSVKGTLRVAYDLADLPLQKHSRSELEQIAEKGSSLERSTARKLIETMEKGEPVMAAYSAPVAVWQLGEELRLVALPSEVVVDYVPMIEKAIGPLQLWVVAYSNDYFGYIPSPRVLKEGGYETRGLFSGEGWFAPETAQVLVDKVSELAAGLKKAHKN